MFVRVVAPKTLTVRVVTPSSKVSRVIVNKGATGAQGAQGAMGPTGPTGATGATGAKGDAGTNGTNGIGYTGVTSVSTITIGSGLKTFTLVSSYAGAFITGQRIRAIHSDTPTYYMEGPANYVGGGTLIITVDKYNGSGSHNSWLFAVAGEVGQTGAIGSSGVISVTAPITNSGTSTSAVIGINQSALTITESQVTGLTTDLANKVNTSAVGSSNGVASLDGSGLVPTSQIPPLAISDTFVVASQAAMLALTAQVGDVAIRTDISTTFILQASPPTTLANWKQILTPAAPVQSVDGLTGNVSLTSSYDAYGAATTVQGNLTTHTSATTSVHGISNTANLVYTSDSRLTNARTPTAHASTHASGGSDAITITESQVTNLTTDLAAKAPTANPTFTGTVTTPLSTAGFVTTTSGGVLGTSLLAIAATTATATTGVGYMGLPQNATTTGAYTTVAADGGKHIYASATRTVTIDSNANLAFPVGTTLTFIAGSGATMTIAITTDTMYLAGAGTTGSRTLAPFGMATAVKLTATTWIISGNGLT
jgi:hypothetical protein